MVNSSKPIMNWEEDNYLILECILFLFQSNLQPSILDGFVHFPSLFRVKFQLAPKCRNQNTIEHDEKNEELEGYRFFGTSERDTRRQRDPLPRRQRPE